MKSSTSTLMRSLVGRSAIAVAAIAACGSAVALPSFTFNPSGAGLIGSTFTADNLLISDYATVTSTATGFNETGFLQITGAQVGGSSFSPTGLGGPNGTYGLYIGFTGSATNAVSFGGFTAGNFDTLTYTLYGYNGPTQPNSFTSTSAPTPSVTLGSGSLVSGTFSGSSSGNTVTSASATTNLTFAASESGFFASPNPFYGLAQAAFNNTPSEITTTNPGTGFTVTQGGGSVNFLASPVPEPETYALMLGGLAAVGFVARRRSNG